MVQEAQLDHLDDRVGRLAGSGGGGSGTGAGRPAGGRSASAFGGLGGLAFGAASFPSACWPASGLVFGSVTAGLLSASPPPAKPQAAGRDQGALAAPPGLASAPSPVNSCLSFSKKLLRRGETVLRSCSASSRSSSSWRGVRCVGVSTTATNNRSPRRR